MNVAIPASIRHPGEGRGPGSQHRLGLWRRDGLGPGLRRDDGPSL